MANDDTLDTGPTLPSDLPGRQRRPQRSCDLCRQRKTRCDGPKTADGRCSNCLAFGSACEYLQQPRKRGPRNVTMEQLKKENESLKAKLRSLSLCSQCSEQLQSLPAHGSGSFKRRLGIHPGTSENDRSPSPHPKEPTDQQDFDGDALVPQLDKFSLEPEPVAYFGPGSSFGLASNAIEMREKYLGRPLPPLTFRPLFWDVLPWEKEAFDRRVDYVYPDDDLIASLVDIFFATNFGGTLLSVLAVASRYSNDPRVFMPDDTSLSSGWKFANQIRILRSLFDPSIHELQMYCLLSLFVLGTSTPQVSWLYIGLGIRFIQQRGEHRRKRPSSKPDSEDELSKRVFWSFVLLERISCLFLGRPMGLHVEEYDVNLPLEVDDEYWDAGFVQPSGKPSQLSYFNCHLRLVEILADAMRRLYGSKKSKILLGWDGPEWEQRAVAELDSAMNDFNVDSIPPHLRWDPENLPQGTFFDQAAILHITYNHILIAIHRPYIQRATAQGAPSLSICARAARAILHTAGIWLDKLHRVPLPSLINPVFVSAVVLIVYMLATKRAGLPIHRNKDLILIATALDVLKVAESRLQAVGRLWEILRNICALDGPLAIPMDTQPHPERPVTSTPVPRSVLSLPRGSQSSLQAQSPEPEPDFWATLTSGESQSQSQSHTLEPGMSIEQLLADGDPLDSSMLDDDLMSMWMGAPGMNMAMGEGDWDAYGENPNITDVNWFAQWRA
ncbi:fungal-specific transcription factor domain-containing protein [Mycena galopus ATCC 62051]|nr:fungal-specific transcription factor domain-containing protein [Mycena galopus ATCC 62051]